MCTPVTPVTPGNGVPKLEDSDAIQRGIGLLWQRQLPTGDWPQENVAGVSGNPASPSRLSADLRPKSMFFDTQKVDGSH